MYIELVRTAAALTCERLAASAPNPDRDACNRTPIGECVEFCSRMCIGAARRRYRFDEEAG